MSDVVPGEVPDSSTDDLTAERLRNAIRTGVPLVLGGGLSPDRAMPAGQEAFPIPDPESAVDAAILRRVLLDPNLAVEADPRGLTLEGAIVTGSLDLDYATLGFPLNLDRCRLTDRLRLLSAHLTSLSLRGTQLAGKDDYGISLDADGLQVDRNVFLDWGFDAAGAVRILDAKIAGELSFRGAQLSGTDQAGISLGADGLVVGHGAFFEDGFRAAGVVRLLGAHIAGQLSLKGAQLTGTDRDGISFGADNLQVENNMYLDEGFTAAGAVRLSGAHIAGYFSAKGAKLDGVDHEGTSLAADGIQVDSIAALDGRLTTAGAIRLSGAHITGHLTLKGARLTGWDHSGNSLVADGLQVGSNVFLDGGFAAAGAIRLSGTHIVGYLSVKGSQLTRADRSGNSLVADGLQVDSNVFLDGGFAAAGAIRLSGAHIAGHLSLRGAQVTAADQSGNSLIATNLQSDGDVLLDQGFSAAGAVKISRAQIAGELSLCEARLGKNATGNSLVADGLYGDPDLVFDAAFTAEGVITLLAAKIGNLTVASAPTGSKPTAEQLPKLGSMRGWQLRDVHGVIRDHRKAAAAWLDTPKEFVAQPWQELADIYDRNGQPSDARWMRYQAAVRSTRNSRSWLVKAARTLYRGTTGHGYYPLLALGWVVAIFAITFAVTVCWAADFTTASTSVIRQDLIARSTSGSHPESAAEATEGTPTRVTAAGSLPRRRAAGDGCYTGPTKTTIPTSAPFRGRVPAEWYATSWDVPCLTPLDYALAIALPVATNPQPWQPPSDWRGTLYAILRTLSWIFTAVLLAGITGLLRKQS